MPEQIDPFRLSFDKAIAYFKAKLPLPSTSWDTFADEAADFAFAIAGVTKAELLNDVYNLILSALENGDSFQEFKKEFNEAIDKAGWNPANRPWRANLIFGQNLRNAYSAGRHKQQTDPEMLKLRPYWQYFHSDSHVPRPAHLALDGKIYPASDPVWKTIYPPCFPPGTLVATPGGWTPIENIKQGDLVIGGSGNINPVTTIHLTPYKGQIFRVVTENSISVFSTPNHRFLTMRGWIRAENLQVGDVLVQSREASRINISISNIDKLDAVPSYLSVPSPVKRNPVTAKALNPSFNFGQKNVYPKAVYPVIVNRLKTQCAEMSEHHAFNSGRRNKTVRMPRWIFSKSLFQAGACFFGNIRVFPSNLKTLFNSFLSNVWAEKRRIILKFFGRTPSTFVNIFSLTQSRVFTLTLPVFAYFRQNLPTQFSSFNIVNPLVGNRSAGIARFNIKMLHQFHDCMVTHAPSTAQLPSGQPFINVEVTEGFASGAPLDSFNSLESFQAYARSHLILNPIVEINSSYYSGSVHNLSVWEDETYSVLNSIVHNCGFGCRCRIFALSQRDLEREGLTVDTPPTERVKIKDKVTGEVKSVPAIDGQAIAEPGFTTPPGASKKEDKNRILKQAAQRLPPQLQEQVKRELKRGK